MFGNNWFKNIILNLRIAFHSLFRGMKSADVKMTGTVQGGNISDSGIEQGVEQQSVLNDLLNAEVTQEVQELVDSNYRVLRHADDYEYLGNGNVIKKTKNMMMDDLKIFNPENYHVRLIQDNKLIVKGIVEATENRYDNDGDVASEDKNFSYTIKVERDNFPRFLIEKWVKKIVVREVDNSQVKIDLYCSSYARQFNPTDSLFINELMNIYGKKTRNIDTVDIASIEFTTSKAYGVDDIIFFKFESMIYEGMNMYDKDFVITYKAYPVCDGIDLTEKYRTKEMDEKYATNAPKKNPAAISFEDLYYEKNTLDTNQALTLLKEFNKND